MRLCELANYFDKYPVLGPSEIDTYLFHMKDIQSKTNDSFESLLNTYPLCIKHNDKTSNELKELLTQLEFENLWVPNFNKLNLMISNCSYEAELFKVKFLGFAEDGKAIFKFKDRNVCVYYNKPLELNKDYLILADFYYTVSGIANNPTYLSVHCVIELNDYILPYFKDYSETHFNKIYLCHPLNMVLNYNFGLATKCKNPRRDRIYKAVTTKNINLLTYDDYKDLVEVNNEL